MSWKSLITTKGVGAQKEAPAAKGNAGAAAKTPVSGGDAGNNSNNNNIAAKKQANAATPAKPVAAIPNSVAKENSPLSPQAQQAPRVNNAANVPIENLRRGSVRAPQQAAPKQETKMIGHFHVSYIFWAEFDIDKGSVLQLQHPKKWPYNNPMYV